MPSGHLTRAANVLNAQSKGEFFACLCHPLFPKSKWHVPLPAYRFAYASYSQLCQSLCPPNGSKPIGYVSRTKKIKKWGTGFPSVGWCMINTVSKNHIQTRKIERGIAKQLLSQQHRSARLCKVTEFIHDAQPRCRLLRFIYGYVLLGPFLSNNFFQIFLFFPRKTGKTGKTGNISKVWKNWTGGKIFGTLRIPILGDKKKENMEIKIIARKKMKI